MANGVFAQVTEVSAPTPTRDQGRSRAIRFILAALLLCTAASIGVTLIDLGLDVDVKTQLETGGKVLLLVLSALGGLYVLDEGQRHARELQRSGGDLANQQIALQHLFGTEQRRLQEEQERRHDQFRDDLERRQVVWQNELQEAQRIAEEQRREEARQREELLPAFIVLSESVIAATSAFSKLVELAPGLSTEALVETLTDALRCRSEYQRAIKKLSVLHALDAIHAPVLEKYSRLLISIIIDVQRPASVSGSQLEGYSKVMLGHLQHLSTIDRQVNEVVAVLLGRRPSRPPPRPIIANAR